MAAVKSASRTRRQEATVRSALRVPEQSLQEYGVSFNSPGVTRDFLRLRLGREEREVFARLFMNAQKQLIEHNAMFCGTFTQTSVCHHGIARRHDASPLCQMQFAQSMFGNALLPCCTYRNARKGRK